jgi:diguanylate cyclase (GGDEF)-like protein/PAS domain S-box-containing protein
MKLTQVMGILAVLLGFSVIIGWFAHIAFLIRLFQSSNNVVFNTGLGFLLAGSALLTPDKYPHLQKSLQIMIGTLVALLAGLTLSQNIFHYSLGIDQLFVMNWLPDHNPNPGRMATNGTLALLFAGLTLVLFPYLYKKPAAMFAQLFIFSLLILGFSALAGYVFNIEELYSWNAYAHMSPQSALGNAILGLGLWSYWYKKTNLVEFSPEREEKKIISLSTTIVFCVVLLIGSILIRFVPETTVESPSILHAKLQQPILLAVLVGLSILLWQLFPFIRQLLRAEKEMLKANSLIKESENRFRSAFDNAAIGMALVSPQEKFLRVNQSLCYLLGYSEHELLEIDLSKIIHEEDFNNNKTFIKTMLEGNIKTYQSVQRYFHKAGEVVWMSVSMSLVCDHNNAPLYFITQLQNITAEKKAEEQLRHLAYHDTLTGLLNRNSLEQRLQEILAAASRHQDGFCVIFLDLDRFKNINDTIGHDAGDMLLQIASKRLKNNIRNTDAIARVGGDEFIIVLNALNKVDKITNVVRKVIDSLQKRIVIKGHELYITTSIGVSVYPYDGTDVATLMKNADLALYRAKELGRNNYQFCTPEMTSKAQQKMTRQNAIIQAFAKNEFQLYYQPKLDLNSQRISGLEALLRWHNPEYKNVNAAEIIHLAEDTGLILILNEWVLKTACKQLNEWHKKGFAGLSVSVNLSARQFKQSNFIESLTKSLEETGFPAHCLELEITEALIMHDPEYILNILHTLKEKGVCIAIDDFGTGYSSLGYLRRFSIDKIKIDRKFIQSISTDPANSSVVGAMIAMANKLGINTVAEGVETREQYEFLLREKCTEIQGYYLSPPVDAEKMLNFLQNPMMQSFLMRSTEKK